MEGDFGWRTLRLVWRLRGLAGVLCGQDQVGADFAPGVAGVEGAGVGDFADSTRRRRVSGTRGGPGGVFDHDGVDFFDGPTVGGLAAGVAHLARFPDGDRIGEGGGFPTRIAADGWREFPFRRGWCAGSGMGTMLRVVIFAMRERAMGVVAAGVTL